MAYTTPTTRSTGNVLSASNWNTDMVDNVKWLAHESSGGAPMARVYNSTNFSVATASLTAITFNSERFDVGSCHSTSSNTSRLTVPSGGGGVYEIGGCVQYAANATGVRSTSVYLNGTTPIAVNSLPSVAAVAFAHQVSCFYRLSAADYVELCIYQTSGGNLNIEAASNYSPEFWFRWVGI